MSDTSFGSAAAAQPKTTLSLAWLTAPARQVVGHLQRRHLARQMACIAPRLREDAGLDLGHAQRG